jgi:hypothetical protein
MAAEFKREWTNFPGKAKSIIYIIRCTIVVDFDHILRQAFFLVALATIRNMDIWYYFRIKLIF